MSVLQIIIKITGGIEKILDFTIILGIPSKLLGALFGFLESYLLVFIALFLLSMLPATNELILESRLGGVIMESSPGLSNLTQESVMAVKEIISIKNQNVHNKKEYNKKCLDILLKYDIVKRETVDELIEKGKLTF